MAGEIYVYRQVAPEIPFEPIHNLDELKNELIKYLSIERNEDFKGCHPEDYTRGNIDQFNKGYSLIKDQIEQGNLDDIKQIIESESIILTWKDPRQLTEEDFENDNNPVFVKLDELNNLKEGKTLSNKESEHIISLNITHDGETIGSFDMLDGDSGKTYSLGIWDGGNRNNLYVCPLDPKVDMEERDVKYLAEVLSPDVLGRVQSAYDTKEIDSLILYKDDLKIDKSEWIQDERFADWIERIENGDRDFSDKELSLYQEMTNGDYPKLDALEARTNMKDNDISLDSAEKIISGYVDQINEKNPLVHSKTDNELRPQYQLLSTDKDYENDTLKMKFLDREDSGFRSKTFSYSQDSGMVSEMDTTMVRGRDNMLAPETTIVDSINIKEMQSQTNTQSIQEEKIITRVNRIEGMER